MKIEEKIIKVLADLSPFIEADGGYIEFVKYENKYVYIKMGGHCANCEMIDYTLKDNILSYLKEQIPEIEGVINLPL